MVPPQSQCSSQCSVAVCIPKLHDSCVLLEPIHSLAAKYQLCDGKCLVNHQTRATRDYIILNPTDEPILLKSKSTVAIASLIDPEDIHSIDEKQFEANIGDMGVTAASGEQQANDNDPDSLAATAKSLGIDLKQSNLTEEQKIELLTFLGSQRDVFATDISELGCTDKYYLKIDTGDAPPVRQRFYRQTPRARAESQRQRTFKTKYY